MTRKTHRYGMHFSAEAVGSFENLVQFGERSRDMVSLDDFPFGIWRPSSARHKSRRRSARRSSASAKLRPNARPSVRETPPWHCAIERELRERGVRTTPRDDIFKIMPEVPKAASKIHYGSQTEIMVANIVQEKLAPKQSRGMRR